ncbi:MAG: PSD1 and planctomycete cytochrome C domain-containing protein [Planctomycetota bacterium]
MSTLSPGRLVLVGAVLAAAWPHVDSVPAEAYADPAPVDFARDVRPILSDNCFSCHGPDAKTRAAGLRLDLEDEALADLGGYAAVTPGSPDDSEVWHRVSTDFDGDRMPPPDSGLELSADEIDTLRRWIEEGAAWSRHWSFEPLSARGAPDARDPDWARDDLDRYVLARLRQEGLAPSAEAEREVLLRRVTLDLTGLPPTPEEADAFLADARPGAYERVVDRLLASPRFGERMALPWLDAARYADTNGYHRDASRTMWLWRDWLIDALNDNKPYDDFVVEQLAGDLLDDPTTEQLVATGFNRNHMLNDEGGAIPDEYQVEYVVDRVRTTSTVFLGLTMACAQCHDHKYDPISQEDYYRFYAFFNKLPEKGLDGSNGPAEPALVVPRGEEEAEITALQADVDAIAAKMAVPRPEADAAQAEWEREAAELQARRWRALTPFAVSADNGAELTVLEDASVLAGGPNPDVADYELRAETDATGLTAIWLEVLRHDSFAHEGIARTTHGNYVLSELEVEAISKLDPTRRETVELSAAAADYSQKKYEIRRAIDGELGTGWAVDGHVQHEERNAVFLATRPFGFEGGTELVVRMRHRFGSQHTLGRVRFSVTDDPALIGGAAAAKSVALGPWHLLGPVEGDPDALFSRGAEPEAGVDLAAEQAGARWIARPDLGDGEAHELRGTNSAFYLYRSVRSDAPRTLSLSLGSDDSIAVWMNGRRVLARDAKRPVEPDQERVDVPVRAGENELLLKVVNYGGAGGFYFRVAGMGPAVLPGVVTRALSRPEAERTDGDGAALRDHFRRNLLPEWAGWTARIEELERRMGEVRDSAPALMVMHDEPGVRETHMLERGQYSNPGRVVTAAGPSFLPPIVARNGGEPDRLDLARWMVDPGHPLTARVAVNRLWQTLFGAGLVATPEDFGAQGEFPEHRELLDRLALDFIEGGWDVKGLLRRIVLSATYRQASTTSAALREHDPRNRLYARASAYRLPAELVRDSALFAAGLLVETRGGPSVRPYQPAGLWKEVSFNNTSDERRDSDFYEPDSGDGLYRRGMYTFWKRSLPPPSLQTFDAPTREVCTVRRGATNTPLQALVLMNDPTYVEAARVFGQRILQEGGATDEARLRFAFRSAVSRCPRDDEMKLLQSTLVGERATFREDVESAKALISNGEFPLDKDLDPAELAAWTTLASVLLNLDETITRE